MARGTRQRTAAQRSTKDEDVVRAGETLVQSEEEQEREIRTMRARNASNNVNAQNGLDIGVLTALFVTATTFLRYLDGDSALPAIFAGLQTLLLPLSLSPHWLPAIAPVTRKWHTYLVGVHLLIFTFAIRIQFLQPDWKVFQIARWALPELIAGAIEIQRKSERDMEARFVAWEKLVYNSKGA